MIKRCGTCAIYDNYNGACQLMRVPMNDNSPGCEYHRTELSVCPVCHHAIIEGGTWLTLEDRYVLVCDDCGQEGYSCLTCLHHRPAPQCVIEQYNGPLDPIIQVTKVQQQGFVRIEQSFPQLNPEVLNQVCPTCTCGSPWNCQRFHCCKNWEPKI